MQTGREYPVRQLRRERAQHVLRLAGRLRQMGMREVAHRLGSLGQHRLRVLLDRGGFPPSAERTRRAFARALGPIACDRLGTSLGARSFIAPAERDGLVECARARGWTEAIASGRSLLDGEMRLLGHAVPLDQDRIDWASDPSSGVRWPAIPLREADVVAFGADVKFVWELNRLQFLPTLGRAYWLSDDPRYVERAAAVIDDWIGANPYGRGVNWASSLEVGLRAIAWLWTMPFMLSWPGVRGEFLARWLSSLAEHYAHLRSGLSLYTDPTNHLIGEATALWMLSVCLPALPGAARSAQIALDILVEQAERQVASDGTHREQAFAYQRFVLEFYVQVLALMRRLGQTAPDVLRERVVAMLDCLATLADGNGRIPRLGDGDDGRALPVLEVAPCDVRHLLAIGGALFERGDWKARVGASLEAVAWTLGVTAVTGFDRIAAQPPAHRSRIIAEGGYCLFQAAGDHGRLRLLFDVGGLGLPPHAAHGHADALAVTVSVNDRPLLDDPGTASYFDTEVRDALRGSAAHSTLSVDGQDQADAFASFKWVHLPAVTLRRRHLGARYDYALASHDGYARLRAPIRHSRAVLFVRAEGWIMVDHVAGRGRHRFSRHFICPPTIAVEQETPTSVVLHDAGGNVGLRLTFAEPPRGEAQARVTLRDAIWSEAYGARRRTTAIAVETIGEPPLTFFTFVDPLPRSRHGAARPLEPRAAAVDGTAAAICRLGNVVVMLNPDRATVDLPGTLRTDAEFLYARLSDDAAAPTEAFVGGGGRLEMGGRIIVACAPDTSVAWPDVPPPMVTP